MNEREPKLRLRPARLPEDDAFLRELYASRREDLKMLPLEPSQIDGLINMQYDAQYAGYAAEFPMAEHLIVEVDDVRAGRYMIDRSGETEHWVIDIAIAPAHRGRGIASTILSASISQARDVGKALTLRVDPANPALQLYLRLGGQVTGGDATSLILRWCKDEDTKGEADV